MKKRGLNLIAAVMISCLFCACSKDKPVDNIIKESKQPTEFATATETPTPTKEPDKEDTKEYTNPLNFTDYEYYKEPVAANEFGDVFLKAKVGKNPKIDDKYVTHVYVEVYDKKDIIANYYLSDEPITDEDYLQSEPVLDSYFVNMDVENHVKDKELNYKEVTYINTERIKNNNIQKVMGLKKSTLLLMDNKLNKRLEMDYDGFCQYLFNSECSRYYYEEGGSIFMHDVAMDIDNRITTKKSTIVNTISDVITYEGIDYILLNAKAGDLNEYEMMIDASTGEIVEIYSPERGMAVVEGNVYIEYAYTGDEQNKWIVFSPDSNTGALDYEWDGTGGYMIQYVLEDDSILFTYTHKGKIYLKLFDKDGNVLGSTLLEEKIDANLENENKDENDYENDYEGPYMYCSPSYLDNATLLLTVGNKDSECCFYEWNIQKDNDVIPELTVKKHEDTFDEVVLEEKLDLSEYIPGEVSEELLTLKEKADELEKKHGIEIEIGDECCNIVGGYAMSPLNTYEVVEQCLDCLEAELEKYPDNFFEQFKNDEWNKGIKVSITGTLSGVDEYNLDVAGGFHSKYENYDFIAIDGQFPDNITTTFNHELSHAIDKKIDNIELEKEMEILDDEKWCELNPQEFKDGDVYTYDYGKYGYEDAYKYSYDDMYWTEGKLEDAYFIDSYSMTFPTEDRARLFENIMVDYQNYYYEDADHLKDKINYYAQCIRQAFDTTGWEDVIWEKYLE